MSNVYGITSEAECRARIDELLLRNQEAQRAPFGEEVKVITSRLTDLYKKGNTTRAQELMSPIESAYFWPAIQEAHARRPLLNKRDTWVEGLNDIEDTLKYHRPGENGSREQNVDAVP